MDSYLDRLAETEPALIVLDLHLPHVMEQKMLAYVRQQHRLQQTRMLLVDFYPI